eukprot:GFUD01040823.1.p1 GENE.GFUD01040823.1~~GFUD01040823.1.p1  ORF type:complete len:293 (+),score=105.92 GFUD01040823.1:44-922(+)
MPRKRFPKDPDAPKKPTRPFLFYMKEVAKSVKVEMTSTVGTGSGVPRECARRWAAMGSEEKEKYHEMFREDDKRYQMALKDYKPSAEYMEKKRLAKLHNTSVNDECSATVPQMVKSYFDFVAGSWAGVTESLPGLDPDQVQQEIWRRWCEGEPGESGGQNKQGWDGNQNVVKKKNKKRNRKKKIDSDNPRAPRPAFQLFLATIKDELVKQLPDLAYRDMVSNVAAKWKVMTEQQKEPFFELERAEKQMYETEIREKLNSEKEEVKASNENLNGEASSNTTMTMEGMAKKTIT